MTLLAQTSGDKRIYLFIPALGEILLLISFKDFDVVSGSKKSERRSFRILKNANPILR